MPSHASAPSAGPSDPPGRAGLLRAVRLVALAVLAVAAAGAVALATIPGAAERASAFTGHGSLAAGVIDRSAETLGGAFATAREALAPAGERLAASPVAPLALAASLAFGLGIAVGSALGRRRVLRAIAAPLTRLRTLSEGDLASPVPGTGRKDEAGRIALATALLRDAAVAGRAREAALRDAVDAANRRAAEPPLRTPPAPPRPQAAPPAAAGQDGDATLIADVLRILAEEVRAAADPPAPSPTAPSAPAAPDRPEARADTPLPRIAAA